MIMKELCNIAIALCTQINKAIKENGYEHEQWVLDYEDKLNELSVEF